MVWLNKIISERTWGVLAIHVGVLKKLKLKLRQNSNYDTDKLSPDQLLYKCRAPYKLKTVLMSPTIYLAHSGYDLNSLGENRM